LKKRYVLLITIIISIVIVIALFINNINRKTYVYEVDINGNDIMLKDFIMISSNNSIYIPNTYYLEKVGNKKVSDLSMSLTYNDKEIMSWALSFDLNISNDLGETFIKKISINPNAQILFRLKYKLDGKEQDISESIDLEDCIKYSN
jgi:hypothetical protein